ncbi:hypothetical protein [Xanthomonas hortorum]|uniref:HrpE protein n=1 Tax=Xanthomonas hortorum pv. pelargonii TaxID=453602 RepID=A0A6V7BSN5_9XANT|nr:hypothetical protein [Xanthomonas hortorum]MCE4353832.1 hypothetical protein [Xanthomonas hortorum pv. pelargonii]MCM5522732.1 hypothetical protein [Xanthomonas hortorum pv. pelargonii]MCM5535305.1 hypothetical protein [Xanthomonas hortorum pv. pelargonii]MCM5538834.1 hypothetical protein [Xanthomonas hortorum pv. pelargonii]MCM5543188.1 hypothetical protein [Xanthomonas hortorum pv. pelargonii]
MSLLEGINRGGSAKDLLSNTFKDKFDSEISSMGQSGQANSFMGGVGDSVSTTIKSNNYVSREMNALNLNASLNNVIRKFGETMKDATR